MLASSLVNQQIKTGLKMEREDPEEKSHREAQFLIYKTLKQADQIAMKRPFSPSSSFSWLRLRISKLKVKIGKRLLRLRKTITILSSSKPKVVGVRKNVMGHLKSLKRLFSGGRSGGASGGAAIRRLPRPLLA